MPKDLAHEPAVAAVVGAGLIGCSWAALFAAAGLPVFLYDSRPDTAQAMQAFWENVKPTLVELGLASPDVVPDFRCPASLAEAVASADLVQECIPERLDAKLELYRAIEPHLKPGAIVATSSSGFKLSDLQAGFQVPGRIIIAHPFNPPHLIPLVELYANERTDDDVLRNAAALYERCGKVTITLKREVLGHVANRLQAALWREAISLVTEGVATLKDVDTAVRTGPGLRWAVMGPHLLLNLGGGEGGLRAYCEQFRDSYHHWWQDLGQPQLTNDAISQLVQGLQEEIDGRTYAELREQRDVQLVALLRALKSTAPQDAETSGTLS